MAAHEMQSPEYGSFYHLIFHQSESYMPQPWDEDGQMYGSGRDALCQLIDYGCTTRGWKRFFVPTFFCQDVVRAFMSTGIEVVLYPDYPSTKSPDITDIHFRPGDVLLRMNYFGIRASFPLDGIDRDAVEVADDHTHDLWSDWAWNSDADWCAASFRKLLPLPDGGVLWSPRKHEMPPQPPVTEERRLASLEKLGAMALRALYLEGQAIEKDIFRRLAVRAGDDIEKGPISGMPEWTLNLLRQFPLEKWRNKRRENARALKDVLSGLSWLTQLLPEDDTLTCPFGGVLLFDSQERRDFIRDRLIDRKIYLPILWELDDQAMPGIPFEQVEMARRIIMVPCDMRYEKSEVLEVGRLIRELGQAYEESSTPNSEEAGAFSLTSGR